ncbi:flagellar basal-body MS-ring/collar protein FliF [Brevundimonas sp.]|uniref:flagellar basal-body MS-ring/collar protein FliF n=1 Tax=Brevundimonas sp. TaxID=1871086 RepID=UPI002D7620AC|nr:flagellar basal-body MS-ring/collar protein FliF [Brevundimonas sp.]HYC68872.1 flagellar basal-body MS-ring/collar protein FliF [Brevundimonas sp.]
MSLIDRIRAQPAGVQIAAAGAAALLIAMLLALAWFAMRPKYDVLFSDLRPADAATIVAALEKDNIPHRIDDGGATILAPAAQVDEIRLGIMGADLPLKGTVGFELFNKSDMGLTEFAQRINYQRALQGELARTIMTIEAVDTARVHLTLPEPSIFRADRRPAEASVTLTTRPGRTLTPETVLGIQRLVGAAAPDLDPANVVVLDARGALVAGGPVPIDSALADTPADLQQIGAIEQYYTAAVRRALEPLYPGVRVAALVPADQWAAVGSAARDEAIDRWRPDSRDFRLQISVSAPRGFNDTQRDDIGRIVIAETGWAAERGDVLVFPEWAAEPQLSEPAAATPEAVSALEPTPAPLDRTSARLPFAWAAAAVATIVTLALVLFRRRAPARGTLSADEREAYVRRLRRLLAEEGGHVR